jgi:hypothetical protein
MAWDELRSAWAHQQEIYAVKKNLPRPVDSALEDKQTASLAPNSSEKESKTKVQSGSSLGDTRSTGEASLHSGGGALQYTETGVSTVRVSIMGLSVAQSGERQEYSKLLSRILGPPRRDVLDLLLFHSGELLIFWHWCGFLYGLYHLSALRGPCLSVPHCDRCRLFPPGNLG